MGKILLSSINFAPDHAGIAIYSTDLALYLAEHKNLVSVVTGFPYYPSWTKTNTDKRRLFAATNFNDLTIFRGYLFVPRKVNTIKRMVHEISFVFFATLNFFRVKRPDALIIFSPPFLLGLLGVFAKWLWRCPLIINIQDLPVDAVASLGMVKQGFFLRLIQNLEGWIYKKADLVVTISPLMLSNIQKKGVEIDRLLLVPNWINVNELALVNACGRFKRDHPEALNKLTLVYAGNIGIKQGIDSLLYLARELNNQIQVHIFIIGDGADKARIVDLAGRLQLNNVSFLPLMSPLEYRSMLEEVDIVFLAQRGGAGNNFFPSKLLGVMAQKKPLLAAADLDSELARVIVESGAGLVSPYGDIDSLTSNLKILNSDETRRSMGLSGYQWVQQFDREIVLMHFHDKINHLIESSLSK